jgi:hypothetical protein
MTSTAELKAVSFATIFDKRSRTSGRLASAIIYAVILAGEIIDWWFPVNVNKI